MQELLKADNRVIGRFDSRFKGIGYDPNGSHFDPSFETLRAAYTATINDYLRNDLKYETDLTYETLAGISWNWNSAQNRYLQVEQSLSRAMSQNPAMKVWVAAGYYDLAISYGATEHALHEMMLDPALLGNISLTTYDGGHMLYNSGPALKKFKSDFETFLDSTLHPKQ
jgi:carboxypeptidase C (cathepsin A)